MRLRHFFVIAILLAAPGLKAQGDSLAAIADSLYKEKKFKECAPRYIQAAEQSAMSYEKKTGYYNAACCFALAGDSSAAIKYLQKAVYEYGYRNIDNILNDRDLISLHGTQAWGNIAAYLYAYKKKLSDPSAARIITTDIHNFWAAYDKAWKDTAHMQEIFQREYFDKGTPGLQDYTATKIHSVARFAVNQKNKPRFYAAIRSNTFAVDSMKDDIYKSFYKFKELYADAVFPDIYFVIGRWNSAGTVSDNGLLLGLDQIAKSSTVPLDELNLWERNGFREIRGLPVIVAHELIHSQQNKLARDTTLLSYAIAEGMADFFAELLTGINPSQRQYDFAKDKKKKIWQDFEKEMYLNRYDSWIANGEDERPDHPSDLGYYIGYEICRSYYDEMADKKQAIIDILAIRDYRNFLDESKYVQKMAALP